MSNEPRRFPQTFFQPEPGACQIILVRHGQSQEKLENIDFDIVDGRGNPALSDLGRQQAQRVGERLKEEPIAAIYASTLGRTQETAAPLAAHLSLDVVIDGRLREVGIGIGEGGRFRMMAADGHPAVIEMMSAREWGSIPEAETNYQLTQRTVEAVSEIAYTHPDEMVVIVCHGGVIGALVGHATGTDAFTFLGSRNASVSHLSVLGEKWVLRLYNDGAHCGPLMADDPVI